MPKFFHKQMNQLADTLVMEANAAAKAMNRASKAFSDANLAKAEKVIDADRKIDFLERSVDEMGVSLLEKTPTSSDLRYVVSALRLSATLERMGDLARHVAYIARARYPQTVLNGEIREVLMQMAQRAVTVGESVAKLIENQDLTLAQKIETEDDILDTLHEKTFEYVLNENYDLTRQEIVDVVLLARYLERFGDHGVSVAQRMQYMINGLGNSTDPFNSLTFSPVAD